MRRDACLLMLYKEEMLQQTEALDLGRKRESITL